MSAEVREVARQIQSMEIRGAGAIARAAARALRDFAEAYSGDDPEELKNDIKRMAKLLNDTRPTAVSLANAIHATIRGINELSDAESVRRAVMEAGDEFIREAEAAREKIGELASHHISDNAIILTHCNSAAVVSSIVHAHKEGKGVRAIAREARPVYQGRITARELSEAGVPTMLIVDSATRHVMKGVDVILVGADTVEASGDVINKIGTSGLAALAHEFNVPFIVCAETYKFSPKTLLGQRTVLEERAPSEIVDPADLPGVRIFNPVFDITPAKYIENIICEKGAILPNEAATIIRKYLS